MNVKDRSSLAELRPVGTGQALTSSDTPQSFTSFGDCRAVLMTVRTQAISVTVDGETSPDAAVGLNLPAGDVRLWSKEAAEAMSIHQSAGGAATVYAQGMA